MWGGWIFCESHVQNSLHIHAYWRAPMKHWVLLGSGSPEATVRQILFRGDVIMRYFEKDHLSQCSVVELWNTMPYVNAVVSSGSSLREQILWGF